MLDELAGYALDETVEADLEAAGAGEAQSRLDVCREVRVVLPGFVEIARESSPHCSSVRPARWRS